MGCGGSKLKTDAAPGNKSEPDKGKTSTGLYRQDTSFVRSTEGNREAGYVPGQGGLSSRKSQGRQRSMSHDHIKVPSNLGALGALDEAKADVETGISSQRYGGRSGRQRSQSLSMAEGGAMRVHGWVVAKEAKAGGRTAGRIAVRAEGNLELRTQLARSAARHENFTPEEATFVLETIAPHFLFRSMTKEQQTRLLMHFQRRTLTPKEVLLKQDEEGAREFYIVSSGCLEVQVRKTADSEPVVVAQLSRSACLGEMALLYACKRTATVTAMVGTEVLSLSREAYQLILMDEDTDPAEPTTGANIDQTQLSRLTGLRTAKWVYDLIPPQNRKDLARVVIDITVGANVNLLQSGRVAGVLIVITRGKVSFHGDASKKTRDGGIWRESALGELCSDTTLTAGDVVALGRPGEEGMLAAFHATSSSAEGKLRCVGGTHHHTALRALSEVSYLAVPLSELIHLIGPHADIIASTDGRRALLQNLPWAASLSKKEVDALAFASKPCIYSPGDVLVRQGERPQFLHLIVSGLVTVSHDAGPGSRPQLMCTSTAGDVVGERELVTSTFAFATATAAGDKSVFCLLLDASDYETLAPSRKELALQRGWPMSQSGTEVNEYSLVDLKVKAVVGSGAFAQVALVRHAKSARVFALKRMNRAHLEVQKVVKQVLNERFILGDFHHPCIARLVSTFKSKVSLYMLLEPCMGGELFTRMRVLRRLEEPHACFYAACVVSAFDYMQSRAVIYRDLKPENIMIHSDGYVRVVDFGFAKRVFTRTYTVCGTPEYLAPELLMMKGHGHGVDWWALGVLLYEMVVGVAPFCFNPQTRKPDPDLPPPELYKNILNPKYELPFPSRLSSEICELIEQLLAWDPLTRLGCLTDGANGIKRLGFFAKIDWQKLYTQRIPPPYKPPLKSDDDFSNFEQHDTLSAEQFLAEQPYDLQNAWDADW